MVSCNREGKPEAFSDGEALSVLDEIDSLMWERPDSAFVLLNQFAASSRADSLDEFEKNYCQLLISELLYKNDYTQSNREELLHAIRFFDTFGNDFLDARAHYINGVGFYELGNVLQACAEYLTALEQMENGYCKGDLVGEKAQFMSLVYNRLTDLFTDQYMIESALACSEHSLGYCLIKPTSPQGVSNILYHRGKLYDMSEQHEKAKTFYEQAIETIPNKKTSLYRDIILASSLCDYQLGKGPEQPLSNIRQLLFEAEGQSERLDRYLIIGFIYFEEKLYDSALFYLEPVFVQTKDETTRIIAAEQLRSIYDSLSKTEVSDVFVRFLADHKKTESDHKVLVSKLGELFNSYLNRKQERVAEQEKRAATKKGLFLGLCVLLITTIILVVLMKYRNRNSQGSQNKQSNSFLEEPVCQKIIQDIQYVRITTRENYYQHHLALDDFTFKGLGEAVERHYPGFDAKLLENYKGMKQEDFLLCYLHLLNLNDKQIALLRQCSYSAIKKQANRLEKRMGISMTIKEFVLKTVAEIDS